jgi:phosphoserine phosphatase
LTLKKRCGRHGASFRPSLPPLTDCVCVHTSLCRSLSLSLRVSMPLSISVGAWAQRVARLAGLPVAALATVEAGLELSDGAMDLCRCLRRLGCTLAVVSGGFVPLVESIRARLGLHSALANQVR